MVLRLQSFSRRYRVTIQPTPHGPRGATFQTCVERPRVLLESLGPSWRLAYPRSNERSPPSPKSLPWPVK